MSEPILTAGDRQSACWQKLKKYLEGQLDILRKRNDSPLDATKTAALRGRIEALKALLSLGTDAPKPPAEDENFKD